MTSANICSILKYRGIQKPRLRCKKPEVFPPKEVNRTVCPTVRSNEATASPLPQLPGDVPPRLPAAAHVHPHQRLVPHPSGCSAAAVSGVFPKSTKVIIFEKGDSHEYNQQRPPAESRVAAMTEIFAALLTGILSLCGVVISNLMTARRTTAKIETNQAVTNEKISELNREVREHNNFARRMPVVEEQISALQHRMKELEREHDR